MRCPTLDQLPPPPPGRAGWPWTEASPELPPTLADGSPWPRVSVVTPSYNQGRFLEETLRSVLLQGYPDLEYIVIDGGSTDDSVSIVRKYERWLAYWVSEPDRGHAHAINKGWRRSTGEYVSWLNSDDLLCPGSLAEMVAHLHKGDAVLAYGNRLILGPDSTLLPEPYDRVQGKRFDLQDMILRWDNPVSQPGYLMSRSLLNQIGYLDEQLDFAIDFEYWVRIALGGYKGFCIPFDAAAFRRHSDSKSVTKQLQRIRDLYRIYDKVFADRCSVRSGILATQSLAGLHLNVARIAHRWGYASYARHWAWQHIVQQGLRASILAWLLLLLSLLGDGCTRTVRAGWRCIRIHVAHKRRAKHRIRAEGKARWPPSFV